MVERNAIIRMLKLVAWAMATSSLFILTFIFVTNWFNPSKITWLALNNFNEYYPELALLLFSCLMTPFITKDLLVKWAADRNK